MSVSIYVERINNRYQNARKQYESAWEKLDKAREGIASINERKKEVQRNGTALEREEYKRMTRERLDELTDAEVKAKAEIYQIEKDYEAALNELIEDADQAIGAMGEARSADVDTRSLELIKDGLLSPKELTRMAEKFSDNQIMKRYIGAEMKRQGEQSADNVLTNQGRKLIDESNENKPLEFLKRYAASSTRGVMTGGHIAPLDVCRDIADGYNARHEVEHSKAYSDSMQF